MSHHTRRDHVAHFVPLAITVFLLLAACAALNMPARGATPKPISLHRYQTGKNVRALQWLLAGHKPSHFKIIAYRGPINGHYDLATAHAVRNMKYRLGWPTRSVQGSTVHGFFFAVLKGKINRPTIYFQRIQARLAALKQIAAEKAKTDCARKVISLARDELGVHETPDGSNDGIRVRVYQAVTGAFRAPWCISFLQYVFKQARVGSPKAWNGAIADNTAGAFYVATWARAHGWLRALPHPAFIVIFLDRLGHGAIVTHVTTTGFYEIGGNESNAVQERFHPFGDRPVVFVAVPGCDTG